MHNRLSLSLVQSQGMPLHESRIRPMTDVVFKPRKDLFTSTVTRKKDDGSDLGTIKNTNHDRSRYTSQLYIHMDFHA